MYAIITENIAGNMHEAAGYINKRPPIYAATLLTIANLSGGACIAVYKVPEATVRWVWEDLRYDMNRCPFD